jgi:putative redox protein
MNRRCIGTNRHWDKLQSDIKETSVPTERFQFTGSDGHQLAAALDTPDGPPLAYALFAHCFTCGKDVLAARRIAAALAAKGIAVLRFDFTGLGSSEGDFANSTFSSNVADLVLAADHLRKTRKAPAILIGHSLGGAAILAAAGQIPDAKAVVTLEAPSDPAHVTHFFGDRIEDIRKEGEVEVQLAGRPFHIKREFLDDIAEHNLMVQVARLHKALLVMHSPTDDTVGIDNATRIFVTAKHPKSFVSLAGADHLLSQRKDSSYVADVIAAWVERYIEPVATKPAAASAEAPRQVVVQETRSSKFQQTVTVGPHKMLADEPLAAGGEDAGPGPYDFLLAGLGACTSMTMRLYADRKALPMERVTVTLKHGKIHARDCEECETREGMLDQIDRVIKIEGALDAEQRRRLMEIADKCPVHRTLTSEIRIVTKAAE